MYKTENHSKYSLKVHLVLVVKYRKKLINKYIDFFLKTKLKQIEERANFKIELMETDCDHIHLLIDYSPKVSILQTVRKIKQETTFELWKFSEDYLKNHFWKERTFWSDEHFVCSTGDGANYNTIQEYIKNQG
mgnify:CR=1 FL=1